MVEKKEKGERFLKHRRNLILLSGVFLFLVFSKGKITKINVLGTEVVFDKPDVVVTILFYCVIYMFIKYFQFLYECNGTGLLESINYKILNVLPKIAQHKIMKDYRLEDVDINDI